MARSLLGVNYESSSRDVGVSYEIFNYAETFEVSQSKKYKNLTWFASPNRYDSGGMLEMLSEDNGLSYIGVWYLLLQLASTMPKRGLFVSDSGKPLNLKRIAVTLRVETSVLAESFEYFKSIGWLVENTQLETIYESTRSELGAREDKIRIDNKRVLSENEVSKPQKKSIEERKEAFKEKVGVHLDKYGKDILNNFFGYWTEHGDGDKKMRWEKEKSFSINRRLGTWKANEKNFKSKMIKNTNTTIGSDKARDYARNF
jgi:hypothetical protein